MAETHEDDYDPYLETFAAIGTQDKQKKNVNEVVVEPATSLPPQVTVKNSSKNQNEKFEYGYQIILNNNEDGLMESFLKEPITDEKTRSDPSDFFNFGLDEEKWRKLLKLLMRRKCPIWTRILPIRNLTSMNGSCPSPRKKTWSRNSKSPSEELKN